MIGARILNPGRQRTRTASRRTFELLGWLRSKTGAIVDVHHPQRGENLAGRIVLMA